ncbi:unnamed protein product [Pleuronectes platessa]|uniref:Uncharacterized protein n=1 Tax=Pleuronectes platessa TaxID=8262 RepID=A0A9N7Z4P5_PLEPL|nr:unnamed protein product [Pleuronectes platessa]
MGNEQERSLLSDEARGLCAVQVSVNVAVHAAGCNCRPPVSAPSGERLEVWAPRSQSCNPNLPNTNSIQSLPALSMSLPLDYMALDLYGSRREAGSEGGERGKTEGICSSLREEV